MKYVVTFVLAVAVSLMMGHVWGPKGGEGVVAAKESAYERVMRTGVLRCGYNYYAPAIEKDEKTGELKGLMIDYMNEIARVANIKVEWTTLVDWGVQTAELQAGKVDAMCHGGWETAKRAKFIAHTTPLAYQTIYAYVRRDDNRYANNLDAWNKANIQITVVENTSIDTAQKERFPLAKPVPMPPMSVEADSLMAVVARKADMALISKADAELYMESNPHSVRLLSSEPVRVQGNTLMVSNDDMRLWNMLNTAVRELQNAGVMEMLVQKYNRQKPGSFLLAAPLYSTKLD
ncbi:MAG: transporter substrate-binding domain-containing protein [Alphaproteobacteria bacterium]